ncbi:DUF1211 domain-containing protein [Schleiferilactobacillus harbinensis]|uniref:TMEM175 family protein n=1 Tax=Schleiferilactobacillus harbinensis TaxID=304207 RepID=UPI0021A64ED6|nr:TMEM175 family protein [Schleiferilactobacillus harbinensis]MCT2907721.1 DUF1211 domain-containing protein [Schleiferilactobacillus harbinensis]
MFQNSHSRLVAISDGVFAVVLTLMVLDIDVPERITWATMSATGWKVLLYMISFGVVAQYWIYHEELFHAIKEPTIQLLVYNFIYLGFICLTPFATSFLSDHPREQAGALMFAGVIFLVDAVQFILFRLVIRAGGGRAQLTPHDQEEYRGAATMLIISGVYIVVGLILPQWLLLVIVLGLFGRTVQTHLWRRWAARHGQ